MSNPKSVDRHIEPIMVVYPVRIEASQLAIIHRIAKQEDRTRQALVREAISQWIDRRKR
jgi:predicted transcriptional regulator